MYEIDWLAKISRKTDPRDFIRSPFNISINGRNFLCATDGSCLFAVDVYGAKLVRNIDKDIEGVIFDIINSGGVKKQANFLNLKEWIGSSGRSVCDCCMGKGCREGEGDERCDEDGWVGDIKNYGKILGIPINRSIIASHFRNISDDSALISISDLKPLKAIIISGDDFFVFIMQTMCSPTDSFYYDEFSGWE